MGEIPGLKFTRKSSGDMSSNQYTAVALSTTNDAKGCIRVAVRGDKLAGVWLGDSTAAEFGAIQVTGVAKLQAGDSSASDTAIASGNIVVASSVGRAVRSTGAGQYVIGQALAPLATGSTGVIDVLLTIGAIST